MPAIEIHPVVIYARQRDWDYRRAAKFFRCPYGVFKQIVRGFCGLSVSRADEWERLSNGECRAIDLLRWHERNRRQQEPQGSAA